MPIPKRTKRQPAAKYDVQLSVLRESLHDPNTWENAPTIQLANGSVLQFLPGEAEYKTIEMSDEQRLISLYTFTAEEIAAMQQEEAAFFPMLSTAIPNRDGTWVHKPQFMPKAVSLSTGDWNVSEDEVLQAFTACPFFPIDYERAQALLADCQHTVSEVAPGEYEHRFTFSTEKDPIWYPHKPIQARGCSCPIEDDGLEGK